MKRTGKRLFSNLLAISMLFGALLPMSASAAETGLAVTGIVFQNGAGKTLCALEDSGTVSAGVTLQNNAEIEKTPIVILAEYDEKGTLKQAKTAEEAIASGAQKQLTVSDFSYSCTSETNMEQEANPKKYGSVKLFALDGASSLKPLTAAVLLSHENEKNVLLSQNAFASETAFYTKAACAWEQEGTYAPAVSASASLMTDGDTKTPVPLDNENGSALIFDLQNTYRISELRLWEIADDTAAMAEFEVYGSLNGDYFSLLGEQSLFGEKNEETGERETVLSLADKPFARFLKIVVKNGATNKTKLCEAAVYGEMSGEKTLLAGAGSTATYTWKTEEPFATASDLTNADSARTALTDGDSENGVTTVGSYATALFDLKNYYAVSDIRIAAGTENGVATTDTVEVKYSLDGYRYFSQGYTAAKADGSFAICGNSGQNARFVKLIFHKNDAVSQMKLYEVSVFGYSPYANAENDKTVPVKASLKSNSLVYLDWSSYNAPSNVTGYRVYIETTDFQSTQGLSAKAVSSRAAETPSETVTASTRFCSYSLLAPEQEYYIAVVPQTANGEETELRTLRIVTPSVLGENLTTLFNINDYPYGGSAHENHTNEAANLNTKLDLLAETETVNNSRYWGVTEELAQKYAYHGIGFYALGTPTTTDDWKTTFDKKGIYSGSSYNEPCEEILNAYNAGGDTEAQKVAAGKAKALEVVTQMQKSSDAKNSINSKAMTFEPALAGTEYERWNMCLTWMYDVNNGKLPGDGIDIHPYCKQSNGGLSSTLTTKSLPELLTDKTNKIKSLLNTYGESDKPIIFSELGWSTHTNENAMLAPVDEKTQAAYLARAYLLSAAESVKQVYWYNFQDEGTDSSDMEKNFGLIDWNCKPKTSYYSYYTTSRALKNAVYSKKLSGLSDYNYGYVFRDERKGSYVTALWTAEKASKYVTIASNEDELLLQRIDGSMERISVSNGKALIEISEAPVFVYGKKELSVQSVSKKAILSHNNDMPATYSDSGLTQVKTGASYTTEILEGDTDHTALTDGKITENWKTTPWNTSTMTETVIFDLKGEYYLTRAEVWGMYDPNGEKSSGTKREIASVKAELSRDSVNWKETDFVQSDKTGVEAGAQYATPCDLGKTPARYVKLTITKTADAHQMVLSEIAIFGLETATGRTTPSVLTHEGNVPALYQSASKLSAGASYTSQNIEGDTENTKLTDGDLTGTWVTTKWGENEATVTFTFSNEVYVTQADVWGMHDMTAKSGVNRAFDTISVEGRRENGTWFAMGEKTADPTGVENGSMYRTAVSIADTKVKEVKITMTKKAEVSQMAIADIVLMGYAAS